MNRYEAAYSLRYARAIKRGIPAAEAAVQVACSMTSFNAFAIAKMRARAFEDAKEAVLVAVDEAHKLLDVGSEPAPKRARSA